MNSNSTEMTDSLKVQIEEFKAIRPAYVVMSKVLERILSQIKKDLDVSAIIQCRVKGISNFAEKAIRKRSKYGDPVHKMDDLCGGRVITTSEDDIQPVRRAIHQWFDILEEEDVLERLDISEFGYRGVHYVVSFKEDRLAEWLKQLKQLGKNDYKELLDVEGFELQNENDPKKVSQYLCQHREEDKPGSIDGKSGSRFRAEIQVRSLLQHVWGLLSHDRIYKAQFDVPDEIKRRVGRIAATIEELDHTFASTIRDVDAYASYYGTYAPKKDRENKLQEQLTILSVDQDNRKLAQETARLALSLEEWGIAKDNLKESVSEWQESPKGEKFEDLYKDWSHKTNSRKPDLQRIEDIEHKMKDFQDSRMSEVFVDYGRALWSKGDPDGREHLERAINLDRRNVNAYVFLAETYLAEHITKRALEQYENAFRVFPSHPQVLCGLIQCRIVTDRCLDFVKMSRGSLENAIQQCRAWIRVKMHLPHAYYQIGFFSLLLREPYEALNAYAKAVLLSESSSEIEREEKNIREFEDIVSNVLPEIVWIRRFLLAAKTAKLQQMAKDNPEDVQTKLDIAREACRKESSEDTVDLAEGKIVLIAGGCDIRYENKIQEYRELFEHAFKNYQGTVFCGCTNSGVNKLVGDLFAEDKSLVKIAYIPNSIPNWVEKHPAFEKTIVTDGQGFSALDSIQNWIDLLAMGIDPTDVVLIGINGGRIAAFEYRQALAMGATAAIFSASGRAASDIFEDEDWRDTEGLLGLPNDKETARLIISGYELSETLARHREELAEKAHEEYLTQERPKVYKKHPSIKEWNKLSEDLKESNRQQIDYYEELLSVVGLAIRFVGEENKDKIKLYTFEPEQLEKLAPLEHGRWNAERLLSGWRLGPGPKDIEKKLTPHLVSWSELPDDIKQYDYTPILKMPEKLKEFGYEIYKSAFPR